MSMAVLTSKQILLEKNTKDPSSITVLTLTHKALTDVSCLGEFKNLERLDLGFNALTSLEGLKSCGNLKWLSVVQNKLESLKGIEGLTKLAVLNAGKNKLKSMSEVASLVGLRALILNDNEIVSICKLDQMKELNTLVLSRNPIRNIGESLLKTKSMTKLSLSNCQLQEIGSSLKSCTELKELRLAHNDIKILAGELAHNKKLQNLDVGNNLITKWSDVEVLSSLVYLKNLNLQGNPIAEKESLAKKIKKLLPNLKFFNSRPTDKTNKKESDKAENSQTDFKRKLGFQKDVETDAAPDYKQSKEHHLLDRIGDKPINDMRDIELKPLRSRKQEANHFGKEVSDQIQTVAETKLMKKLKKIQNNENNIMETPAKDPDEEMEVKPKKQKTAKHLKGKASEIQGYSGIAKIGIDKRFEGKAKQRESRVLAHDNLASGNGNEDVGEKSFPSIDANVSITTFKAKKKKHSNRGLAADPLQLSSDAEFGLGGPSTWDD